MAILIFLHVNANNFVVGQMRFIFKVILIQEAAFQSTCNREAFRL
jgi:hypothetical protein